MYIRMKLTGPMLNSWKLHRQDWQLVWELMEKSLNVMARQIKKWDAELLAQKVGHTILHFQKLIFCFVPFFFGEVTREDMSRDVMSNRKLIGVTLLSNYA